MKATLEFSLPEEVYEFTVAQQGYKWKSIVEDIDEHLRKKIKYEDLPKSKQDVYQEIRDYLTQLRNETLDDGY